MPIRYWDKGFKVWLVPLYSKVNIKAIQKLVSEENFSITRDATKEIEIAIGVWKISNKNYKKMFEVKKAIAKWKLNNPDEDVDINMWLPKLPVYLKGVKLDPEQEVIYNIACRLPSYPLFMEAGTGKTIVSLAIMAYKHKRRGIKKILLIHHNPNLGEWLEHIEQYFKIDGLKINHKGKVIKKQKNPKLTLEIMNYDIVSNNKTRLFTWRADMIVLDESHNIKNKSSNRTKDLTYLGDFVKYKNILTGTEIDGKYVDYYSQFKFLSPDAMAFSWDDFINKFCIMGRHHNVEGYRNVDKLRDIVNKYTYPVYLSSLDIPTPKYKIVKLPNINKKHYDKLKNNRVLKVKDKRIMTSYTISKRRKLLEITSGFLLTDYNYEEDVQPVLYFKRNPKLDWTVDFLTRHKQKIIVFCNRLEEVKIVAKRCELHHLSYIILNGDTKDTDATKQSFKTKYQILIAMVQKGGIGLNLQFCSITIFFSLPESWIQYDQAIKRTYRRKQEKHAKFYFLMLENSEDYVVKDALDNKQNYIDYIKGEK